MNVTRDFAPPFSLIAPFFLIGAIFYFLSMLGLFSLSSSASYLDMATIGWVHLFLLGFVMMVIFGAMAQLVPVVIEVGHAAVDFFYIIWPMLTLGTILMVSGFAFAPALLPYGGLIVLLSMVIFAADLFATLRIGERESIVVSSVKASNVFLLLGILSGFIMALSFGGMLDIDPNHWLKAHVYAVFGGYVMLTIMGLSMVLLPMFGLSHGFNDKPMLWAYRLMVTGVSLVMIGSLLSIGFVEVLGILAVIGSVLSYFYQGYLMKKVRARKENDVWVKSLNFAFITLAVALFEAIIYLLGGSERFVMSAGWFLMMGFVGFLITSHLYKIIPFLVWFERYAPLVGKQKVPMLNDMIPLREANMQMYVTATGTTLVGVAILVHSDTLFNAGVSVLVIGGAFLLYSVYAMMQYGKEVL
ncbi:MAG: hypothetical protein U9P71_06000 [Campylobacterota bacterium]|nr:hypothetical protein [Campylobacterota bacterium]